MKRCMALWAVLGCATQQPPPAFSDASDVTKDSADTAAADTAVDVVPEGGDGGDLFAPPRQVSPPNTSVVNTRRPRFRWALSQGVDGAVVEVCRDRGCNVVVTRIMATGTSAEPEVDLPPGVLFWRLLARRGSAQGTRRSVPWTFTAVTRNARSTTAWGTLLDVNGDGHADLAVGAPGTEAMTAPAGAVYVYVAADTELPGLPTFTLRTMEPRSARFGASVASAGDVDGDGFGDLLVGAPGDFEGMNNQGLVFLYRGAVTGLGELPTAVLRGAARGNGFGQRVASAGDVNADGYGDVLVASPTAQTVWLYLGGPDGLTEARSRPLTNVAATSLFGQSVAGVGDVNGDGYGDILVGAPGEGARRGRVYVYHGAQEGVLPSPLPLTSPDAMDGLYGQSVAGAGDINGDGFADVILGAPASGAGRTGRAYLAVGSTAGLQGGGLSRIEAPAGASNFGAAVAGVGDLNADGTSDVVVGAPGDPSAVGPASAGTAYVFLGSGLGVDPMPAYAVTAMADALRTALGASATMMGDVNNDAYADFALGEPLANDGTGRVVLLRGAAMTMGFGTLQTLEGRELRSRFGTSLGGW
ncbi:MAG: FG-GAP repeat protein [Deltaproteobacteria bacterium]|nr:FG-GAP repeat protein [Deltaproteobacteria bacterium]